ncbi:tetratricopeptide repeat protein [Bacillus alkalicellulosilyticus]|uniref:tetratricopeptide repeat protein n=1 Tax=Alkalihalobacterium alkalicellulosilyticum TaxID=1912214 RepID=UPI00099646E2|nr:tetratricopeptide repeat protein [Bacillus alkalicellulosilyticus]
MKKQYFTVVLFLLITFTLSACNSKWVNEQLAAADQHLQLGEYEVAIFIYDEVLQKDEKIELAYIGLSSAYASLGKNEESVDVLLLGIEKVKEIQQLKRTLGTRYYEQKKYSQAEETWTALLAEDKSDITTYEALLTLYYDQEEFEKATYIMEEAVQENPSNAQVHSTLANLYI